MGNSMAFLKHFKDSSFKPHSIILITGASSGIGEELAYQYACRKVKLFLCARSMERLEKVAKKCRELGSECEFMHCDVSNEKDCKDVIETCVDTFGGIDLLVVNAGVNAHVFFEHVKDMSVYEKLMKTNFFGYLYPTKYAFPHLKRSKGQILVISSVAGEVGCPMRTAYCASKFAVTGFFEALRIETRGSGVSITIVCPPSVETPMREHALIKAHQQEENNESNNHVVHVAPTESGREEKRIPVDTCVSNIILAADKKARKVYFPAALYVSNYVRPFVPWVIDEVITRKAKL